MSKINVLEQKIKKALFYALQPRIIIIFVALCNFVWFFSRSKAVKEFGSDIITFGHGPWYYEGAHAGKPFLLLFAVLFMLSNRWWGYLITVVISGIYVIEGINWIYDKSGFLSGLSQRIELISTNLDSRICDFLDWQYLLALIIFIIASGYLIASIIKIKQKNIT